MRLFFKTGLRPTRLTFCAHGDGGLPVHGGHSLWPYVHETHVYCDVYAATVEMYVSYLQKLDCKGKK
jgi:hypothetical protein